MKNPPILIRKIKQVDNSSFLIEWSDGINHTFRLSRLQGLCPCAQCYDPIAGKRTPNSPQVQNNVSATKIENVGRYALKVHFTSGCTKGIYSFALLREIGNGGGIHV